MRTDILAVLLPAALLRLRGDGDTALTELEEMKEEAAHTQGGVTIQQFFRKQRYKQPIIIVLVTNLGSQLSGFNAVLPAFCTSIIRTTGLMRSLLSASAMPW